MPRIGNKDGTEDPINETLFDETHGMDFHYYGKHNRKTTYDLKMGSA